MSQAIPEHAALLFQELPRFIVDIDENSLILYANKHTKAIKQEQDLAGKNWKDIFLLNPENEVNFIISPEGGITFQSCFLDLNDIQHFVDWNVINKEQGKKGFLLFGVEVTHTLKKHNEDKQRSKMELLGRLSGGLAHELNNFLQPILLSSEFLTEQDQEEKTSKYLEKIHRNATAASEMVGEILRFSHKPNNIEGLSIPIEKTLNDIIPLFQDNLPETCKVKYKSPKFDNTAEIPINRADLRSVLMNLVKNASDAVDGKGTIKLTAEQTHISYPGVDDLEGGTYCKINVIDKGHGIKEKDMENIFHPFFTTKDIGKGTGLGLPISYDIIKNAGGTIKVQSTEGKGTTFTVYLPIIS